MIYAPENRPNVPHKNRRETVREPGTFNDFHNLHCCLAMSLIHQNTTHTCSAFSQYSSFPVKWLRYLNSSWSVDTSAVLTRFGLSGLITPSRRAKLIMLVGRPEGVSKAGRIRSPRSCAFCRKRSSPVRLYAESRPPRTRMVVYYPYTPG